MGFNKRKMESRRRKAAEQEAESRRATEKQILEDADHLIAVPMLFSPTIGAAITAGGPQPITLAQFEMALLALSVT